jgi:CheY-like chemotaxis protein
LIVLDFSIPRMNGLQVAAALKVMQLDISIILFTSYVDSIPEERYLSIGIRSMVSRTSPIEVLMAEVHRLVGTARAASA